MAKGKRISEIAKDLGIPSKDIIAKCKAEGISDDMVKSHASVVSAGLEASIREWFSTDGATTAIETSQHVDVQKIKAKPATARRRLGGDDAGGSDDSDHGGTATAAPPAEHPSAPAHRPAPSRPQPLDDRPAAAPLRPRPVTLAPVAPTAVPAPAAKPAAPARPHSPSGEPVPSGLSGPTQTMPPVPGAAEGRPVSAPAVPPGGPRAFVTPAPMNVPQRPTNVVPAGKKLEIKSAVKLSGPKVVRVEAPEQIDVRSPRRPSTGTGGPMRGGRGVTTGTTTAGDDDKGARRNKRRSAGDSGLSTAAKRRPAGGAEEVPVGTGFSEADLAEREARLARAGGYLKQRRREMRARETASGERAHTAAELGGKVEITAPFTIKELAAATGIKSSDIMKKLFMQGIMATANSGIDAERAQEIMIDFDIELDVKTAKTAEETVAGVFTDRKRIDEQPRPPIVTIMGHVDHGKTSLLDKIRNAKVAEGEAGGITQKTSAFRTEVEVGGEKKHIVFLDTPGHEAFTEMRSRGANLTDIIVLVVGAPEGVMPQTVESINHAKAAKVPIVVALNKIDSPQATEGQIQKIFGQLAENGLNPIAWGGQTEVVKTSALKGTGIQELLETIDLTSQVLELKADFAGLARGRVVEAQLDEGRGPVATVMILEGELKIGDFIVAGRAFGRVRDITNDRGIRIKQAGPAMPVQVSGIDEVPAAGDPFFVAESSRNAEEAAQQRRDRDRLANLHQPKVTLDSLFSQMKDASVKEILIVLKADVQGSVDVIKSQIEKLSTAEVKVRVLHAAVGGIVESDILLADASKAVIVGFNVIPTGKARSMAEIKGVEVRTYQVIYDIVEDVKKAASGLLEPEIRQEILGHADVRKVFKVTRVGTVAGCYVTDGMVLRDALIRVTRGGVVVENDRVLEQLKRFKDDARDARAGMECGMKIVGYDDIKEGDVLECYKKVEVKRTL
ncbi:MAG: translation initiation factor IF-2 [Phycisphaerales bacterium]